MESAAARASITSQIGSVRIVELGGNEFEVLFAALGFPQSAREIRCVLIGRLKGETIRDKGIFAEPFNKGHRCLVPVDGLYEFTGPNGQKQPHLFRPKDGRVMAFAC